MIITYPLCPLNPFLSTPAVLKKKKINILLSIKVCFPKSILFLLTSVCGRPLTPINPGSVSVCFTVTWITGLGMFLVNTVMATQSGTVLLFLCGKKKTRFIPLVKWLTFNQKELLDLSIAFPLTLNEK